MHTYIQRLHLEKKERGLIRAIKSAFPSADVQYLYQNNFYGELVLRKLEDDDVVIRVFHLTDFTCDVVNEPANLDYRSMLEFPDYRVKKAYISFMNKTFLDFKEDYLKATNDQALEDLGETL